MNSKLLFAVFGCTVLLWASADAARQAMQSQITPAIRGVNLGGWLVIERFINPSFFSLANDPKVRCEWTWCEKYQNDNETLNILRNHWATWVTEAEIQKIASVGITHLRIPIGYWAYLSQEELNERNEPFQTGQLPHLEQALAWAKKYNLKAIMDLHGAPGSQNGFDNSGHADVLLWGTGDTINRTLDVIERMSKHILSLESKNETSGVVVGLELLNEAATFKTDLVGGVDTVKDYYIKGYDVARKYLPADKYTIVIEGAFQAYAWSGFMPSPQYENVQLDLHIYHCFDAGMRAAPYNAHLSITCNIDINQLINQTLPTFIGEWSTAWKVESDYAAGEPFPDEDQQTFMKNFIAAQMYAYDSWYWWNFKCEDAVMWDLFTGYDNGWFPVVPATQVANACDAYITA